MPITGRTLAEAAAKFRDHLNDVLARTVTRTPLVMVEALGRFQLAFRQGGGPVEAMLGTRFGRVGLYLGQTCESTVEGGLHRLRTVSYRYTLRPEGAEDALLRWEYEKAPEVPHCRHHLQGTPALEFGRAGTVSLNALHLPTGFTTIEEVLRFCIVDLGAAPLSEDWDRILRESYELFKGDFAPQGQR